MTVTVKLITEQTTNQLVDSVNAAQTMGWFPVCGVVCFNARYTQLMAQDTERTEPPKCNYFIVDAEDGISFAQRVNQLLDLSPGAVCLSSVQYVQARYIQAYGDDSLHNGGGGGGLPWYSEAMFAGFNVVPALKIDQTLPYVTIDATASQMAALAIVTGYGTSGSDVEVPLQLIGSHFNDQWQWQITGDQAHTGQIVAQDGYMMVECGGKDGNKAKMTLSSGDVDDPKGASLEAGATRLTLLDKSGSDLTIADGQEFVIKSGVDTVFKVNDVSGNLTTEVTAGNSHVTLDTNKLSIVNTTGTLEMDATATRFKRGTNQMLSMSDGGGAMTWNSIIRCAWNADGWNVSRDNGVAFTSRATYAAMMGPNGSRAEASNTGLTLLSSDNTTQQSKLAMLNGDIKGYVTSPAEPFLEVNALNTTLRYVGNELKLQDGVNASLSSAGADVILNAPTGNVTFNAQGQSMSVGPAGLRYTVDGVDVIQSGSAASRSAPDLTIHRPGGGDMMLDMTTSSARLQSSATSYVDVANAGASTKIGNTLFNVADNGMVTVSTNVDAYAPNLWLAQYTAGQGHSVAPGADNPQQQYLVIGGREWGVNSVKGIGFGYEKAATDWAPAFFGYREVNSSGATGWGDLFFATRNVNTNTQPTERLRITSEGQITAAAGYTPVAGGNQAVCR